MSEEKALAKSDEKQLAELLGNLSAERPAFIPEGDRTGTEGITQDDLRFPRLSIAQGLSPQVTPGKSEYIPGLSLFQMFNDTTKQVYGNGPLLFIPIKRDVRCIEFKPRSEGGGIVDMNVSRHDKRATQWRLVDGKRVPPVATIFEEFVCFLLKADGSTETVVISIKHTNKHNRKAVGELNRLISAFATEKGVPIYGVIYSISTRSESNASGTFGVPSFEARGFIPNNDFGAALFLKSAEYHESLKGKEITVTREGADAPDSVLDGDVVENPAF